MVYSNEIPRRKISYVHDYEYSTVADVRGEKDKAGMLRIPVARIQLYTMSFVFRMSAGLLRLK